MEDARAAAREAPQDAWLRAEVDLTEAHAALVFDGEVAVAWCEYGTPEELPNEAGFSFERTKGTKKCVMRRTVLTRLGTSGSCARDDLCRPARCA
jgi:hypothetical protein